MVCHPGPKLTKCSSRSSNLLIVSLESQIYLNNLLNLLRLWDLCSAAAMLLMALLLPENTGRRLKIIVPPHCPTPPNAAPSPGASEVVMDCSSCLPARSRRSCSGPPARRRGRCSSLPVCEAGAERLLPAGGAASAHPLPRRSCSCQSARSRGGWTGPAA
jgi:hypothetical protein